MMKLLIFLSALVLLSSSQAQQVPGTVEVDNQQPNEFNCNTTDATFPSTICYVPGCADHIVAHVQDELHAAFSYMFLAAHFADERVARPGLAKFLYESASEERHHAIMMLEYLNKRGIKYDKKYEFGPDRITGLNKAPSYSDALETALKMEIEVTNSIYNIIAACGHDFHGADFFTEPILDEQHEGVRKLQGAIRTFSDLKEGNSNDPHGNALAEFIFDNKILANGL